MTNLDDRQKYTRLQRLLTCTAGRQNLVGSPFHCFPTESSEQNKYPGRDFHSLDGHLPGNDRPLLLMTRSTGKLQQTPSAPRSYSRQTYFKQRAEEAVGHVFFSDLLSS